MKRSKLRRASAVALLLAFTLPQAAQAAAPTVETDETVYINLDYYGAPTDTRIVKGANLNGQTEFTDYGDYTDVYNMSTYDTPELTDGSVTWKLSDDAGQRFYYECIPNTDTPITLPWDFDVSYKLNGVSVKAEDCAGASGTVEMSVHATPNDAASDYYKNNMMLICATGIDMSKALSIEAPGAQIQSFGTYKLVMFMGLPGEEETFTVRIGSDDFETMGMFLCLAPATLSSLDILADMKDIKDRLSDSGDNLYEGMSSMLDTMQSMQSGMDTMSQGIKGVDEVRKQLIRDRGTIDPKTDAALSALEQLAGNSDSLIPELTSMKSTLTTLNATVNSMLGTVQESGADISEYQDLLRKVKISLDNLEDFFDDLDDATGAEDVYISNLQKAVKNLRSELSSLTSNLRSMRTVVSSMSSAKQLIAQKATFDANVWAANGVDPTDIYAFSQALNGLNTLLDSTVSVSTSTIGNLANLTSELDSLLSTTEDMLDTLDEVVSVIDDYKGLPQDFTAEGKKLADLVNTTLERVNTLLADIPALSESLNQLTSDATSAADKGVELLESVNKSLTTGYDLLDSVNTILRSVRSQADSSLQTSIDGVLDVLDKAARSNSASSMHKATDSIHSAIDDAEKDLEDDTNVLNIDSSADLQSVTSDKNPTPTSVQFILRTKEISVDDDDDAITSDQDAADEGVLARIVNIFKKLFTAIVGVFTSDN